MSLVRVYTPAVFLRGAALVLGLALLLPSSATRAAADEPPGPPTNIVLAKAGPGAVKVTWSTPNDTGSGPILYQTATAYRKGLIDSKGAWWEKSSGDCQVTATSGRVSCTIRNLPNGTYNIRVLAVNKVSNNTTILSDPLITVQPNPAVGVACVSKGEVTQVKGKYLECGQSKRWQLVQVGRACVLNGSLAGELFCRAEGSRRQWAGPTVANCAKAAESIRAAAMKCMLARYAKNQPNTSVTVTLKASPTTHKSATAWIKNVLNDSMRMYGSYPGSGTGTIHAYFSLDKEWCLDELQQLTGNRDEYLCEQDGGLNAGSLYARSGWIKRESILFGRPYPGTPSLQAFEQLGAATLLNDNDWALHFIYEMGHATHGLLMSKITGEGQTSFVPILLEVGAARMAAYAYVVGVLGESETRWRATVFERNSPASGILTPYSDPRLSSGGSYQGDAIEWPRVYTLGFLAGEYIVGKYGDEVLFDRLIPAVMRNGGDFDAALRATIGIGENALYSALNQYALEQLRASGHSITQ